MRPAWYVHLYANGWYGGAYGPFPSSKAAEEDASERTALLAQVGCRYLVSQTTGDPRPAIWRQLVDRLEAEAGTHA